MMMALFAVVFAIGGCAHPVKMVGISGGNGASVTISGWDSASLFNKCKTVLEENGCAVTEERPDSNPAMLYCSGSQAGNSKMTITHLSPTSHRVTLFNSQAGMFTDSEEKSFVQHVLHDIQIR